MKWVKFMSYIFLKNLKPSDYAAEILLFVSNYIEL